ncbi:MAG: hypothetical protein WCI22_16535 [Actinomycetota bacterium]
MSEPTTFEIVVRGRANARLLRPLLDDFTLDHTDGGNTRLIGVVRDASHLHGVVAHLTAVNVELISIVPIDRADGERMLTVSIPNLQQRSTHS